MISINSGAKGVFSFKHTLILPWMIHLSSVSILWYLSHITFTSILHMYHASMCLKLSSYDLSRFVSTEWKLSAQHHPHILCLLWLATTSTQHEWKIFAHTFIQSRVFVANCSFCCSRIKKGMDTRMTTEHGDGYQKCGITRLWSNLWV